MMDSGDTVEPLDPFSLNGQLRNFRGRGDEETSPFTLSKGFLILGVKSLVFSKWIGPERYQVGLIQRTYGPC